MKYIGIFLLFLLALITRWIFLPDLLRGTFIAGSYSSGRFDVVVTQTLGSDFYTTMLEVYRDRQPFGSILLDGDGEKVWSVQFSKGDPVTLVHLNGEEIAEVRLSENPASVELRFRGAIHSVVYKDSDGDGKCDALFDSTSPNQIQRLTNGVWSPILLSLQRLAASDFANSQGGDAD